MSARIEGRALADDGGQLARGGLSNIDRLYEDVPRLWTPHVFWDRVSTRVMRARRGDSSGVRGAAWLWD